VGVLGIAMSTQSMTLKYIGMVGGWLSLLAAGTMVISMITEPSTRAQMRPRMLIALVL
jgi:hypothetical protein